MTHQTALIRGLLSEAASHLREGDEAEKSRRAARPATIRKRPKTLTAKQAAKEVRERRKRRYAKKLAAEKHEKRTAARRAFRLRKPNS